MKDDPRIERMAAAIVRSLSNYSQWHHPSDKPRKWRGPSGAVYNTKPLTDSCTDAVNKAAQAALAEAMKPIPMNQMREEYRDGRWVALKLITDGSYSQLNAYFFRDGHWWDDIDRGFPESAFVSFLPLYTETEK